MTTGKKHRSLQRLHLLYMSSRLTSPLGLEMSPAVVCGLLLPVPLSPDLPQLDVAPERAWLCFLQLTHFRAAPQAPPAHSMAPILPREGRRKEPGGKEKGKEARKLGQATKHQGQLPKRRLPPSFSSLSQPRFCGCPLQTWEDHSLGSALTGLGSQAGRA